MSPEIVARPSLPLRGLLLFNRVIQWASLAFLGEWAMYGVLRCPFVVPFVSCQNCPVITCPGRAANMFWGVWGVWLALAVFFGRAFCGWVCPGGLLNRILAKNPFKLHLHPDAVREFSYGKYVVLICVIGVYFLMDQPRVNVPIRIGEFWPSVALTFEHAFPMWLFRTGVLLAVVALGIFVSQAWCRFACPSGGLLELVKQFSLFRVYKTSACNNCGKCRRVCYMDTRPEESNCTNCGDCINACPQKCIGIGHKPR